MHSAIHVKLATIYSRSCAFHSSEQVNRFSCSILQCHYHTTESREKHPEKTPKGKENRESTVQVVLKPNNVGKPRDTRILKTLKLNIENKELKCSYEELKNGNKESLESS